jgi:hypothetical protein
MYYEGAFDCQQTVANSWRMFVRVRITLLQQASSLLPAV